MRIRAIAILAVLVSIGLGLSAADWDETDWGNEIVVDAKTGLPAVVFFVSLEVSLPPDERLINTSWEVYRIVDGTEVPLDGASRTGIRSGDPITMYAASPPVTIEAGQRYGARMTITAADGAVVHMRTFDFTAPTALPFGIRLTGWDGTSEIALTKLPDEELEELALLHDLLAGYSKDAEAVNLDVFLRGNATTAAYPLSLLVLPTVDIETSSGPITMYVIRSLYIYMLSDPAEADGVRGQLLQFEQDLIGTVYTGSGREILGGGATLFVQDTVWPVLEAAAEEQRAR